MDCPYEFLAGMRRGANPSDGVTNLQIRNPEKVQGYFPAGGLGVSPDSIFIVGRGALQCAFTKDGPEG